MKLYKHILYIYFAFLFCGFATAQERPTVAPSIPSAANAEMMDEGVSTNVNQYTGTASVNIPLTSVPGIHTSLPISLGYNASGIKLNQLSGWTGLGWQLSAGGAIVREVRGLPDDWNHVKDDNNNNHYGVGYLYSGQTVDNLTNSLLGQLSTSEQNFLFKDMHDTEPDIFSFNVGGLAGKFFFDKDGNPKLESQSDLKIEYVLNNTFTARNDHSFLTTNASGGITSFTITAPNGTKYTFDQRDYVISESKDDYHINVNNVPSYSECDPFFNYDDYNVDFSYVQPVTSAWYLSKVTNPYGQDEIELSYVDEIYFDHSQIVQWEYQQCGSSPVANTLQAGQSYMNTFLTKRLSRISYGDGWFETYGTIDFITNQNRDDLYHPSNSSGYPKPKALSTIRFKVGGNTVQEFDFSYGWFGETNLSCSGNPPFLAAHRKRLKLESVQEKNGSTTLPPYEFTYDFTVMPPRHSAQMDYWGYYNGNGANSLIPKLYAYPLSNPLASDLRHIFSTYELSGNQGQKITFSGANRDPIFNYTKAGSLKKIKSPLGGTTEMLFEAHHFDAFQSNTEQTGGGLRIKEIKTNDANGNANSINYYYDSNDQLSGGTSSGRLVEMPVFGYLRGTASCDFSPGTLGTENYVRKVAHIGTHDKLKNIPYSVAYNRVAEVSGLGKTTSKFRLNTHYGYGVHGPHVRSIGQRISPPYYGDNYPYPPNPNYEWQNGQLYDQATFNLSGGMVLRKQFTHQLVNHEKIRGIKTHYRSPSPDEDHFSWGKYYLISHNTKLIQARTDEFTTSGIMTTIVDNEYNGNDHHFMTATEMENSDGVVHRTEYKYAPDLNETTLINNYRISSPLEVIKKVGGTTVGGTKVVYKNYLAQCQECSSAYVNIYNPWKFQSWENGAWETEKTIEDYVDLGLMSVEKDAGFGPIKYTYINGLIRFKYSGHNGSFYEFKQQYNYNNKRQLIKTILPDGQVENYTYDVLQRIHSISRRNGNHLTAFDYEVDLVNGGDNYTKTTQTLAGLSGLPKQYTYFDGFGRVYKGVTQGYTYSGSNYTINRTFDANGRVTQICNPNAGGCSTYEYENSPIPKWNKMRPPGWPREVEAKQLFNSAADNVKKSSSSYYTPNSLYKKEIKDEDGKIYYYFRDKIGQLVLKREVVSSTQNADTYYLYDDKGNQTRVMPPGTPYNSSNLHFKYIYYSNNQVWKKHIPGTGWYEFTYYVDSDLLKTKRDNAGNIIRYEYDVLERLEYEKDTYGKILKKYVYYNTTGVEDGRIKEKYVHNSINGSLLKTTYTYDAYGRVNTETVEHHMNGLDTYTYTYDQRDITTNIYREHTNGNSTTTTNKRYVYDHAGRLKEIYMSVNGFAEQQLSKVSYDSKDRMIEKNLGKTGNNYLQSVDYAYNSRSWLTRINNVFYNTFPCPPKARMTKEVNAMTMDQGVEGQGDISFTFDPNAIARQKTTTLDVNYQLQYSAEGNSLSEWNDNVEIELDGAKEDFHGQNLITEVMSLKGAVSFDLIAAGMACRIGDKVRALQNGKEASNFDDAWENKLKDRLLAALNPTDTEKRGTRVNPENDLFSENLYYNTNNSNLNATAQYNGSISHLYWRVGDRLIQGYGFQYDNINRMEQAYFKEYNENNCVWSGADKYTVNMDYADLRGNTSRIRRRGVTAGSGSNLTFGQVDDINMTFSNSRLNTVKENGHQNRGYRGQSNTVTITHDTNGNLKSDLSRGIQRVDYNHLNLPIYITFSKSRISGNIRFYYNADGDLLRKIIVHNSPIYQSTTYDYVAGVEYTNNSLEAIYHEEGRLKKLSRRGWRHEYALTDHLGNSRVFFSDINGNGVIETAASAGEVLQEAHFYPHGMNMEGDWYATTGSANRYLFNGIEQIEDFNLGISNAFFRTLDPALGRWWQTDPLAENFHGLSPYNSMFNNPVGYSDPYGDSPLHAAAAVIGAGINVFNNWDNIVSNPWSAFGYIATGAVAGAVSVGNPAAAKAIAAAGNAITDIASGNLPEINNFGDAVGYTAELAFNAIDVGGAGSIAKAGFKGLADLGSDWASQVIQENSEFFFEAVLTYGPPSTSGGLPDVYETITAVPFGGFVAQSATNAIPGAVSGLVINIDPKDQIDRGLLNKPSRSGNAPTFKSDGTPVEIHHVGQNPEGPFKEMHWKDHRGKGVDKINHPNKGSASKIDRRKFNKAKRKYWREIFKLWK